FVLSPSLLDLLSPFVLLMLLPLPRFTLFPYTTLFRSVGFDSRGLHTHTGVNSDGSYFDLPGCSTFFRPLISALWENAYSTASATDRKSTRLNSSHQIISYAVFCLI